MGSLLSDAEIPRFESGSGFADAIKRTPTGENQGGTQAKREMGVFSLDSPAD